VTFDVTSPFELSRGWNIESSHLITIAAVFQDSDLSGFQAKFRDADWRRILQLDEDFPSLSGQFITTVFSKSTSTGG